jgi:hypothetical protein
MPTPVDHVRYTPVTTPAQDHGVVRPTADQRPDGQVLAGLDVGRQVGHGSGLAIGSTLSAEDGSRLVRQPPGPVVGPAGTRFVTGHFES